MTTVSTVRDTLDPLSKLSIKKIKRNEREPLHFLIESADPNLPLAERVRWLENLIHWIRTAPAAAIPHDFDTASGALHNARVRFLLQILDRHPEWRVRVGTTLGTLFHDTYAFHLLCRAGLSRERGFVAEAVERALRIVLPRPPDDRDLGDLFLRVFLDDADAAWLANLPVETWERLVALVLENTPHRDAIASRWRDELGAALSALGARVATVGTAPEILSRISPSTREMPFLAVNDALSDLARDVTPAHIAAAEKTLDDSRRLVVTIFRSLETSGASVSLVYMLENIGNSLRRATLLTSALTCPPERRSFVQRELVATLVLESVEQRDFTSLIRSNVRLVARKIVERTGVTGEHYIARNRSEYFAMIRAGIGGGALMVFTTLTKFSIHALHLPLFGEFLFYSINYSVSFLLLQGLGFTLATKQPSATASALAGKLEELSDDGEIRDFVDEACRMTRTQIAALIGNLLLLIPLAIGLDSAWVLLFGNHILEPAQARGVVRSVDPIRSFTIVNAALTGVLLWLSSIAAGWLENSVVYRKIPLAISSNRKLIRIIGQNAASTLGNWTLRHATTVGGNVTLGFLMGAVSILGPFFGLPLDVRHVTLSAASLTFASTALIAEGESASFLPLPVLGVLLIGTINFAVAYSLAFYVAVRARDLPRTSIRRLLRAIRFRARRRPLEFFFPRKRRGQEA